MKQNRVDRIFAALKDMGLTQMLIVDPMSPFERFYGLLLRSDGKHAFFLNKLFTVPEEVGVEKVWYSDTDPAMEIVAKYVDKVAKENNANVTVKQFIRFETGEGLEKKEENFADEVASMMK